MKKQEHQLKLLCYAISTLAALVILVDFVAPGSLVNDDIIEVQQVRQNYYNAARNYHYSYKVITNDHSFLVTKDFAALELENKKIEYAVSPLFKEVNWYRLLDSEKKSYSSLRIVSALVLPLLALIAIFLAYGYHKKIGSLVFILQLLLLADLVFLIT
ncbi:hypothetical protein [Cellulophaga sp. Hel_I_12]|uniref:hypothetical protein n=1 Tax=Cellulophaga sp. Hel_I_12 TaxID=1249972 RepID=UPI000646181E|nr:hypothetical protein [Cellulophaga sp. Hel_I_12]